MASSLARSLTIRVLLASVFTLLTYLAYAPGLTGNLFYDDFSNLNPLSQVDDLASARDFVFGGSAGPTGRPLALISFLPHAGGWPDNSLEVLRVNVILHILNAGLLLWLGYLILRLMDRNNEHRAFYISLTAAAIWAVLPLLASTSLIAVQRMTSLSALFGLLGLIAFVYGYFLQSHRPRLALWVQIMGLGLGTLLATLAKENGALIPIFALIIDAVLLKHLAINNTYRLFRRGALWLALLALLVYLSPLYRDWFGFDTNRGWTPFERFQNQWIILWQYLYWAFLPRPTIFGPFYDHIQLVQGWIKPTLAFAGFLLVTLLAYAIRRKNSWLFFALLWFLTGHLLESTVISLELVFEHRNYLAVYGFCLALAYTAWHLPGRLARIGPMLAAIYGFVLLGVLYSTTSIWGNRLEAAENWVQSRPASPRAILHLATEYYHALGNASYALPVLDRSMPECPGCTDVKMQALLYACGRANEAEIRRRFDEVLQSAKDGRKSIALLDSMYPLHELNEKNACPPLTMADARKLPLTLLENPAFSFWSYRVHILFHAAVFAREVGDSEAVEAHLAEAEALAPDAMPILQLQVSFLTHEGRRNDAVAAIERRRNLDRYRFQGMTETALDEMEALLRKLDVESNGSRDDL